MGHLAWSGCTRSGWGFLGWWGGGGESEGGDLFFITCQEFNFTFIAVL
jgi:hypothetical protein